MDGERELGAVSERGLGSSGGRVRVLVVDDEPLLVTTLRVLLEEAYDVTAAESGRDALDILRDDPDFDLVLCDLMMPRVSGIEVFRWLSEAEPELALRTVFMTGGAFTPEGHAFLESVGNPHIKKPFDADALTDALESALGRGGG